jgi:hypothetical protein
LYNANLCTFLFTAQIAFWSRWQLADESASHCSYICPSCIEVFFKHAHRDCWNSKIFIKTHTFTRSSTCRRHFPVLSSFMTYHRFVTRLTRRVPLVELELLTLSEHLSSPPVLSGVSVTRSSVLFVCFVVRCLSFCPFSLGHCVVSFSSIYGFWLPFWYLQTLLSA